MRDAGRAKKVVRDPVDLDSALVLVGREETSAHRASPGRDLAAPVLDLRAGVPGFPLPVRAVMIEMTMMTTGAIAAEIKTMMTTTIGGSAAAGVTGMTTTTRSKRPK
jgi:hypothetical protein